MSGDEREEQVQEQGQKQVSMTQSKMKELRRISQRTQLPTDKAQLIQYLLDRIRQAEDALTDTEQLLEEEIKERKQISHSILMRNEQLEKLYAVDQRALPQKIQEKLTQILTSTVSQKLDAEKILQQERSKSYQYKMMYAELKIEEKNSAGRAQEMKNKEDKLNQNINMLSQQNQRDQEQLKSMEEEFENVKKMKEDVQNKYLQLKVAFERMNDVKTVLNRFFTNEDLFDEKMDLKEQKIVKVEVQQRVVVSRQGKNKLKPIKNNDDEDFWRADFNKKQY